MYMIMLRKDSVILKFVKLELAFRIDKRALNMTPKVSNLQTRMLLHGLRKASI